MFNLETKHKDKSLNFNDPKLMSMIQIKTEEEKHRFSSWKKKREEKLVIKFICMLIYLFFLG